VTDPIELCLAGRISPQVALARAVLAGVTQAEIFARLEGCDGRVAGGLRRALNQSGLDCLRRTADAYGIAHTPTDLASLRAAYDRAVAESPEAAVAAYSLGDAETLANATAEIAAWVKHRGLTGRDCDMLDLGCGIGRIAQAVAPDVRRVIGIDISSGMLAEAWQRLRCYSNICLIQTGGPAIPLANGSIDLVLAVDTFPYIVLAGLAEATMSEISRILRPRGAVAILNLSYRGLEADRDDIARWSARHEFQVVESGAAPFRLWDGTAFLMRRAAD